MLTEKDVEFLKAIDEVVKEKPYRVYGRFDSIPTCKYHDSKDLPGVGCLIGEALKKVNPDLDLSKCREVASRVLSELGYSHDILVYANKLQHKQDMGLYWKQCWEEVKSCRPH